MGWFQHLQNNIGFLCIPHMGCHSNLLDTPHICSFQWYSHILRNANRMLEPSIRQYLCTPRIKEQCFYCTAMITAKTSHEQYHLIHSLREACLKISFSCYQQYLFLHSMFFTSSHDHSSSKTNRTRFTFITFNHVDTLHSTETWTVLALRKKPTKYEFYTNNKQTTRLPGHHG